MKALVSPVMQDVVGQIDEMQAELEMHPVRNDAVSEMRRHQLAVRRVLALLNIQFFPAWESEITQNYQSETYQTERSWARQVSGSYSLISY